MAEEHATMLEAGAGEEASEVLESLQLSRDEQRVLELYDRLQELRLEMALLRTQHSYEIDQDSPVSEAEIRTTQEQLLESRASFTLRNEVVNSVLTAKPILQAVHHGTNATPVERDLLPYIEQRDVTAITIASQASVLRSTLDRLTAAEAEATRAARRNAELAADVLRLAAEQNRYRDAPFGEESGDPEAREQVARLEREVKTSRQKWKVIKGTASAIVAGSGVDWVGDEELRAMVLDPD